jgi:hypothetical protein
MTDAMEEMGLGRQDDIRPVEEAGASDIQHTTGVVWFAEFPRCHCAVPYAVNMAVQARNAKKLNTAGVFAGDLHRLPRAMPSLLELVLWLVG